MLTIFGTISISHMVLSEDAKTKIRLFLFFLLKKNTFGIPRLLTYPYYHLELVVYFNVDIQTVFHIHTFKSDIPLSHDVPIKVRPIAIFPYPTISRQFARYNPIISHRMVCFYSTT